MTNAFKAMFAFLTTLFNAADRGARTLDNYAAWAEEGSQAFLDESRIERAHDISQLKDKLGIKEVHRIGHQESA